MWPGSDSPPPPAPPPGAGPPYGAPPPYGPGPGPGPAGQGRPGAAPLRPRAGWYALPLDLVALAAFGFLGFLGYAWEDSEVADGPSAVGDPVAGIRVRLTEGHGYFLYVRDHGSAPYACAVSLGEVSGPLRLTRTNSWSASEHPPYRYTATFKAPVSGEARLTCRGAAAPVLVTPDDTVHGYLGIAFFAALGVTGLAGVAFVVILARRGAAKRRGVTPYAR
ncbi:hypothetical protein [Actinomadura yumaensis]|uniref:Uncharacterized protein n=1 Tax=Actinomadura yumaensis TaxID=111807 RepID=A0ABW2CWQ0_9ACTN